MTSDPAVLLQLRIASENDVFLARQRGREIAVLIGFENQDQVRVATALSEICRELSALPQPASITLSVAASPTPAMVVAATWVGLLPGGAGAARLADVEGFAAAARLADALELTSRADGGSVTLTKVLPPGAPPLTRARIVELRQASRRSRPGNALDALRIQNHDLLEALEDLKARQEDLVLANAELEETNRGVMALHAELSDELEQTNRGVVALYAELDEASTRLKEASESKTRFWASVSHELRTPLNSVLGLARLLLDPASDALTAEQRHQVAMIHDSGAMLLSLVNELLDVAKAESGRLESHPEPTELRTVFDQVRASMAPLASSDVALVVEEPPDTPRLVTDPLLLGRILRNLVSNALKFTVRGEVRCRADASGERLDIVVSDTGIGIPAEHRSRVFEEFHQVPGPLQRRAAGTGLGLPYARRLAVLLGGALELESEVDRGTTVTLQVPLSGAKALAARFGTVLVVDDDPAFRTVLRHAVEPSADRVAEVGDGTAALRAMRFERPDLVLLDLDIPPPDGQTVLAQMRQDPRLDDVPVVVVTSARLDAARHTALESTAAILDKAQFSGSLLAAAADVASHLVRR